MLHAQQMKDCMFLHLMQVWKMKGWPHQISDGIFVQLESLKPLRSCWFIPLDDKQPQQTSNDYKILEPIFK